MSTPGLRIRDEHEPAVAFHSVSRAFGNGASEVMALNDVTLELAPGEICAITGRSASGKSTLVHLAAGMIAPTAGTVWVGGVDVGSLGAKASAELRRDTVGVVFQRYNLVPSLTALENVTLPLEYAGRPLSEARELAASALERVGVEGPYDRFPDDLSGGEQQRVAIARAVAVRRRVVLADEPTGALDTITGDLVMEVLTGLASDGATVVIVTHEPRVAAWAERVVTLRDGRLVADTAAPGPGLQRALESASRRRVEKVGS